MFGWPLRRVLGRTLFRSRWRRGMRRRFLPRLNILPGFGPRRHIGCTLLGHGPLLRRGPLLRCALLRGALLWRALLWGGLARLRSGMRLWI
jgi:hypothetical protein